MSGRIVVGVDTTLSGLQALRRAVGEARARGLPLHAVRTWAPIPTSWYVSLEEQRQAVAGAASQVVADAFAEILGGLPADVPVEVVVSSGPAGPVLVEYADQPEDLIVVGTGRRGLWHRLRQGVARYCLARAGCPVLVVPAATSAESPRAMLRQLRRDLESL